MKKRTSLKKLSDFFECLIVGYVVVQKSLYFSFHKSQLGRDKIFQEKETLNNGASLII